jgi:hypothetical protein
MIDVGNSYTIGIVSKIKLYCQILSDYLYPVCRAAVKNGFVSSFEKIEGL